MAFQIESTIDIVCRPRLIYYCFDLCCWLLDRLTIWMLGRLKLLDIGM